MNFRNIKLHGNIWLPVEFPVLSPPNFIHNSCIFSWNTRAHTITILFLNSHRLIRREDWTLQVKFSKISIYKILKFKKFPEIKPSQSVWIWHLFFAQGFIKAYYLKTGMCCWEQKQGSLDLRFPHLPFQCTVMIVRKSTSFSILYKAILLTRLRKSGLSCIASCRNTWHSWLQYSLLVHGKKFHLSPRGFSDHSHQHHLIWQQTKSLFRTKCFTYIQLHLSHGYLSSLLVSRDLESRVQRTLVSMIVLHKYVYTGE